jgi:hypothetical protein
MATPEALTAAVVLWLCISLPVSAQQAGKMPLVGVLLINTAADPEPARSLLGNSLRRNHRCHRGTAVSRCARCGKRTGSAMIVLGGPSSFGDTLIGGLDTKAGYTRTVTFKQKAARRVGFELAS